MVEKFEKMFNERATSVAEKARDGKWRWKDYKASDGLVHADSGDDWVEWRRGTSSWAEQGTLRFNNIQPKKVEDMKFHEPFVLRSEDIDATSVELDNSTGIAPLEYTYEATFVKSISEEESFSAGFSLAIRNCFTAGNDATPVKNETEITAEAHSEWGKSKSQTSEVSRTASFTVVVPVGKKLRVFGRRSIEKMRRKVTGKGVFTHSVIIGRHWHGKWYWDGSKEWKTYDEFLSEHRSDKLREPVYNKFEQLIDFDNVTTVRLVQEEL